MTDVRYNRLRKTQRIERARGVRGPNRDATPYREAIQAFMAEGWTPVPVARAADLSTRTVELIADGTWPSIRHRTALALETVTRASLYAKAAPGTYVPNTGVKRRLKALHVMGWSWDALAAESGRGFHARSINDGQLVTAGLHRRVSEVYERLWDVAGPSLITRKRAAAKGWAPPMAWDDSTIDDPTAEPAEWRNVTHRGAARTKRAPGAFVEDVEHLLSAGENVNGITWRLGVKEHSLTDMLRTAGRGDLIERLKRAEVLAS